LVPHLPDFYEANLALLKDHHTHIWHSIVTSPPAPMGEVLLSPGHKPNLQITTTSGKVGSLHRYEDPEMEARHFLDLVPEDSTGVVAFLGLGLGYSPLQLIRQRPNVRHFVVFELHPGIFVRALHLMDLGPLLSDKRVTLSVGPEPDIPEVFRPASRALQLENAHLLQHPPSFAVDPAAYGRLRDAVYEHINKLNVSGATSVRFGHDFVSNRFRQLTSLHHNSYLLEHLQDLFAGIPAILVAGGPSLDQNIHLLPRAKGKALIIAVDTVLPALCRHGVLPDFITSIDPQELTYEKLADVVPLARDVALISVPAVTPRVAKTFPAAGIFWLFSARAMEAWLNTLAGGKTLTAGAGTVAHANILSAVILKCSPIVLVGQDLAFPTTRSHAKHTVLTDQREMQTAQRSDENAMWVEGINGGKVRTNRAFFSDKEYFERIVAENPNHYINATEGGAHIRGTEIMPLEEVLERFCQEEQDIAGRFRAFFKHASPINLTPIVTEFRAVQKKISAVRQLINKADALTREVQKSITLLLQRHTPVDRETSLPQDLQHKLRRIDEYHLRLDSETHLWTLLDELTMEGLRQKERQQHEIAQLAKVPGQYLAWLARGLEMREQINRVRRDALAFFVKHISLVLDHLQKEQQLRTAIAQGVHTEQRLLQLAELYFQSEDLVLAQATLEDLIAVSAHHPEAHLGLGKIALYQTDFDQAEEHFGIAKKRDASVAKRLDEIRQGFASQYLGYAEKYFDVDSGTARKMLLKGLRYCPDHLPLQENLALLATKDLARICAAADNEREEARALLGDWHDALTENSLMATCLSPDTAAAFYRQHAIMCLDTKDYAGALESFQAALTFTPDRPDLLISIADVCFTLGDYPGGITHLKQAVGYDRSYAQFWENMGDNLCRNGQVDAAITAYEQCFMALPEHLRLLRKIGDCHLALGQLEAAREAYLQLKGRLQPGGAEQHTSHPTTAQITHPGVE
jgi:tetratricopeptide (TPR) repeat protein